MGVEAVTPAFKELGTRMTQIYFIFFVVLWIHSNPSKAKYVMWFGILLGAIAVYDVLLRVPGSDAGALSQMLIQAIWPVGYLALTLLLPAFKASCNEEKPVPDRVTG
jgi:ubiquinol-cytochrome c reductase cytochrome b subunit